MKPDTKKKGMTLLEIMIVVGILGLVSAMALGFFIETLKATFTSEQKNLINRDIRNLTSRLSEAARQANFVVLYESFDRADRDTVSDRLLDGNSGDFLVFGFQDEPDLSTSVNAPQPVTRMIGYYRAPEDPGDPSSMGPVRTFDTGILSSPGNPLDPPSPEEILQDLFSDTPMEEHSAVVELSEGLADRRLFYNLGGRTIMVNGKIVHGVEAKRVTDTYNFTIATRR